MVKKLSHTNEHGRAHMVDVGAKTQQMRTARAAGKIEIAEHALQRVRENRMKKGDVLTVAQFAGIQAAKHTADLIPLCHTLILDKVDVQLEIADDGIEALSEVRSTGKTGVEMEALTAVSTALLTIYDMCKAVDNTMKIGHIRLLEKTKENVQ